jgi:hypothetical protein
MIFSGVGIECFSTAVLLSLVQLLFGDSTDTTSGHCRTSIQKSERFYTLSAHLRARESAEDGIVIPEVKCGLKTATTVTECDHDKIKRLDGGIIGCPQSAPPNTGAKIWINFLKLYRLRRPVF